MASFTTFFLMVIMSSLLFLLSASTSAAVAANGTEASSSSPTLSLECEAEPFGACYNKKEAMRLKIIAIFVILAASMVGVCLPLLSRSLPALHPDSDLFSVVKSFASGVILATGYMHVLPDSFDDLRSPCLPKKPWHMFPFTTFAAMLAAAFTLLVDSLMMGFYNKKNQAAMASAAVMDHKSQTSEMVSVAIDHGHGHGHGHGHFGSPQLSQDPGVRRKLTIQRNRVIAQVLEMGIIVHSVIIGLAMGASQSPCTIKPLVVAISFHQLFEGMGLGGCILQAEYKFNMKAILSFFFATTTPLGIVLGIGLSKVYKQNSPTALIVVGILNGVSAGLLNYMALVDLLAAEFMGPKLQSNVKLQLVCFLCVLLGAGGMSVMAIWA